MLILTSTDNLQVSTNAAGAIDVHASWVDRLAGVDSAGRTNSASIATATTINAVVGPAASTARNIRNITIVNAHASGANFVTVFHNDGSNTKELASISLAAGESLVMGEDGKWTHYDIYGGVYGNTLTVFNRPLLGQTGVIAETIPRELCPEVNTAVAATGVLFMQAIYLYAGQTVSNIILWTATTAAGTPTHYMAGLFDGATRNLLATSTDKTTTAWAANAQTTFAMTTPYKVPTSGYYYIGFFMTATTIVTLKGGTAKTGGQLAAAAPILNGASASTGLTTALPNPAGAITGGTASIYAAVS